MKLFLLIGLSFTLAGGITAQERAAGSALEAQVTWTGLSDLAKAASVKADAVNSRVDQVVVCGAKGWVYAPGKPGADAQGCKEPAIPASVVTDLQSLHNSSTSNSSNITKLIQCNAQGQLFNGTSCVAPQAGGFKITRVTTYGSGAYSSNKVVTSGWHTLCVLGFNHNDSNFWLNQTQGPNADGKSVWQATRGAGGAEPILKCMD